jgi:hypothetical protein
MIYLVVREVFFNNFKKLNLVAPVIEPLIAGALKVT